MARGEIEQGFEVERRRAGQPRLVAAAQQAGAARVRLDDALVHEAAGARREAEPERRFFCIEREVERDRPPLAAERAIGSASWRASVVQVVAVSVAAVTPN